MSFKSLVNKLMKEGKSKEAATKIAGKVANAKMKGAGSGPTAKQKARAKSPATKRRKGMEIRGVEPDKKSTYTNKRGKTVELKRYKSKEYKRTTDPDATKETRRASRRSNTLELSKTKTKKDGTTKTRVKRAAGGTKKAERLSRQFKRGARQQGASDVKIERKSPTTMKKSPSKMKKSPAKKPLVGKQKNLPEHLKKAILDAPAKMLSKSGMKMMKEGSPAKIKSDGKSLKETSAPAKDIKGKKKVTPKRSKTIVKNIEKKIVTKKGTKTGSVDAAKAKKSKANAAAAREKGYMMNYNTGQFEPTPNKKGAERRKAANLKSPADMKAPVKKSKKRVEQDYARNAIADYKAGKKKEGNYEKKKALELAAGESGVMMKKSPGMMKTPMMKYDNSPALIKKAPTMMKTNQMGGGVAAKDSAAPAKQLKKLGSILSKHMKSN